MLILLLIFYIASNCPSSLHLLITETDEDSSNDSLSHKDTRDEGDDAAAAAANNDSIDANSAANNNKEVATTTTTPWSNWQKEEGSCCQGKEGVRKAFWRQKVNGGGTH